MKLQFLGAGHGIPTVDRYCSSALLTCGDKHYLIDAGAPVADLLIRKNIAFEDLCAVFITHRHGDHTAGLPHLLDLSNWCFRKASFDVYMTEQRGVDAMLGLMHSYGDVFDTERLRLHVFSAGEVYRDENIAVTAIPTNHMNGQYPSFAFMVEGEGKRLFFTGDLHAGDASDFPQTAKELPSDAVICELAHFKESALLPHLQATKAKRVLINHYNDSWSLRCIEILKKALATPLVKVRDGDVFEF